MKKIFNLQNKGLKPYFAGFLYFAICRKNLYLDRIKYFVAKMKNKDFIKIIVNNNLMYININDPGISMELYNHKKREFFSTDFMKEFVKEDDIVMDIGANIGYYALLESHLANKGSIYAIEPVPSNKKRLDKNVQINDIKNISTFKCAIGDKEGTSKMYIYDKCNWCSFVKSDGTIIDEIDVPIITLDQFIDRYMPRDPTLIRMDLEGYEYQLIKNAKLLKSNKPLKISIELHPHLMTKERFAEILKILKENNFIIKGIFLEPEAHNFKDIKIINGLRKILGLVEFGYIGNDYEDMKDTFAYNVFFER